MATTSDAVRTALEARFPEAFSATAAAPADNEFVIFSKPELGRLGDADLAAVWDLFAAAFEKHGVTVHDVSVATGAPPATDGTMLTTSPSFSFVASRSRYRMSSSLTYTLTKLRSFPSSE